jgi:hypothetical protein
MKNENAENYPAGMNVSGRRARDVMPAAMRAVVSVSAVAVSCVMVERYLKSGGGAIDSRDQKALFNRPALH